MCQKTLPGNINATVYIQLELTFHYRARNNGRSTDNVRTDCGFDRSHCRLAGHVDRSKFNRIENELFQFLFIEVLCIAEL